MDIIQVNSSSGVRFRVLVQDCNGDNITSTDVSSCKYTVYEIGDFSSRTPVEHHTNVTVPLTCFLDEAGTDEHSGSAFNFEHRVSAAEHPPFPNCSREYIVVYLMYDTNGEPHAHEILCRTN